jgi:hypothetical protein
VRPERLDRPACWTAGLASPRDERLDALNRLAAEDGIDGR